MIIEVDKIENECKTIEFLTKLKEDIGTIIGSNINDKDLSYYLGQNNKYVTYLKKILGEIQTLNCLLRKFKNSRVCQEKDIFL